MTGTLRGRTKRRLVKLTRPRDIEKLKPTMPPALMMGNIRDNKILFRKR